MPLEIHFINYQYTDIILAIKPQFAEAIRSQEKNHEYRKYQVRSTVIRFWLYETDPVNAIRYVITVGSPRTPGQVNDPSGLGNDDFDKGLKKSKFGYPILTMDRLNKPILQKDMKRLIGQTPPLRYEYASAELLNRYPANTMHRIFEKKT